MTYNSSKTGAQVDAAVDDVQEAKAASATDTTAGRLLKLGDFGVGAAFGATLTDFNTTQNQGLYGFTTASTANSPSGSTAGGALRLNRSNQQSCWLAADVGGAVGNNEPRLWAKATSATANDWGAWRELLHTGNTPIQPNATQFIVGEGVNERLRIDASGNVLIGTTTTVPGVANTIVGTRISGGVILSSNDNSDAATFNRNSDGELVNFRRSGNVVGSISITTTTTTYNTSSDQRLKENITDAASSAAKIDALQVRQFDWKADGKHQEYGLIAQELEPICPDAVSKGETEDDMWGVDYSKLVPLMLKEIQSLRARVAELENK